MSCDEWEYGQIVLPTAEFTRVRRAVQEADQAIKAEAFELTQRAWQAMTSQESRDPDAYRTAHRHLHVVSEDATADAASAAGDLMTRATHGGKPLRVKKSDVDWPTNRSTVFCAGYDGTVTFDRKASTVIWDVAENNHACDHARDSRVWAALVRALEDVKWTPRTGGAIVGNNEYHRDSYEQGAGGNYTTDGFGPAGAKAGALPRPYQDTKGRWWDQQTRMGRFGFEHKVIEVQPYQPRWGMRQFTPKASGKPKDPCPPKRSGKN